MTEMQEFLDWFTAYAETPLDEQLLARAERQRQNLSAKTLISLGHGVAMVAVLGKVREIMDRRPPP